MVDGKWLGVTLMFLEWKELRKKLPQVFNGLFFCASCELMRIFGTRCFFIAKIFVVFGASDSEVFSFGLFCNAPKALAFRFPFRPWLKKYRENDGRSLQKVPRFWGVFHPHLLKGSKGCDG